MHIHICPHTQSLRNPNLPGEAEPWRHSAAKPPDPRTVFLEGRSVWRPLVLEAIGKLLKRILLGPTPDPANMSKYLRLRPRLHISKKFFGSFSTPLKLENHCPKGSWANPILATCCPGLGMGSEQLSHPHAPAISAHPSPGTHKHCTGERM